MFVHYVQSFRSYHIAARAIHPPPISFALANQQPRTNELSFVRRHVLWLVSLGPRSPGCLGMSWMVLASLA
ncbi:hypothetical protein CGGC5_v006595 [Colletotrichum fructicola Nara gc5]|uniref:Uncharacterized protein n=1 Tax=Colletotrichum fructicola (strain Nara gc5) TaxID=1213859 RepID=A0A7J6J9V4_COLFN|nr:hypothetical protein CFRS1_v008672 [Colletotrichum fructicola]KAF4474587.1 hypothetical protein CGGC5_v017067 [Colletotrichum fructicola Nara gc5]KAF4414212.1 hypothetical protein CFRS1_v008673 [Colletotrichum fructicola]KAF4478950.1 hypothetical protein CGGC5_v011668 [Colletotrichum fructicola Nara gc5]KAF4485906.1 hypothetical protein CGGC5_v006595 [Colletotrichum fructicola Nara gc5]